MLPVRHRLIVAALAVPVVLAALAPVAPAAKKGKTERFLHKDYASFEVQSIGVMPLAFLVQVNLREQEEDPVEVVRRQVERAIRPSGYKFTDARSFQTAAKTAGAAGAWSALDAKWRTSGELDSTSLKALGAAKLADAILAGMVTTWNRMTIDPGVAGQSITEVGMVTALYSTRTGELLWRDSYLEKGEGPYNNPGSGYVTGVQGSSLGNTARTSTALDPPSYDEIMQKVGKRLEKTFPPASKVAPKPAPGGPAAPDSAAKPAS